MSLTTPDTAEEVLQKANEMSDLLGKTYGRLQKELLTPLIERSYKIMEQMQHNEKWDKRFLDLAKHVASWSKDPSTKVGAVIVRPDKTIASTGYNGYPKKMRDIGMENREEKYSRVIHAEMNAIHFCKDQSLEGYTLYVWPMMPCDRCCVHVIQSGISRVVSTDYNSDGRWSESILKSLQYFRSCEVDTQVYPEIAQSELRASPSRQVGHPLASCPLCSNQ